MKVGPLHECRKEEMRDFFIRSKSIGPTGILKKVGLTRETRHFPLR